MLQVQYIGQAVLGNHKNSDEIRSQRGKRADIDLKHNENEWREVDGEQWKRILRNSLTFDGKVSVIESRLGRFEED